MTQIYRATSHGGPVQTTDGTTNTTIHSVDVSSFLDSLHLNECAIYVEGLLLGVDSNSKVCGGQGSRMFKRIQGTLTSLGALVLVFPFGGDLVGTPVMTLDETGTVVRLRVVGVALTTITWDGFLTLSTTGF